MTFQHHPNDPAPLGVLPLTVPRDQRTRDRTAATFASRNRAASGYLVAPLQDGSWQFYRIENGRSRPLSRESAIPHTVAAERVPPVQVALCYDSREDLAFEVAKASLLDHASVPVRVAKLDLRDLLAGGLYTRPTDRLDGRLVDVRSADKTDKGGKPMSTEHAIARFFVPFISDYEGWVLSADSDILVRADIAELFALADPKYAVMVVKHEYTPTEREKMDGQVQSAYARKNWSSVILWNCAHPSHLVLRPGEFGILNRWPGRDLHGFRWLLDDEIGALPVSWNWLVGVNTVSNMTAASLPAGVTEWERVGEQVEVDGVRAQSIRPLVNLAHFTLGTPDMPGYGDQPFADEWRSYAAAEAGE